MPFDFGGALGGIGSFIGNQISSAISSSRQWKYVRKQMYLQDALNRNYTRDSYSLMRQGLSQAGYNPLLALGSSAQQALYSGSASATDSDVGDQAVNSALNAQNFKHQNKLLKEQSEGQELINKHQELENKKLEAELTTSPKNIITEILNNDKNGTLSKVSNRYNQIKQSLESVGINLPSLPVSSAFSSQRVNNKYVLPKEKYTYVQKGVPKSVIKKFEKIEGDKYKVKYVIPQKKKVTNYTWHSGSAWNNSNYKVQYRYLDDLELK